MTTSKDRARLDRTAERLRGQLAAAEAVVADLRARLAKIEAKISGEPPPQTGLDLLWKAALPMARQRSSRIQCRTEWMRIPAGERPTVRAALDALHAWNTCEEWRKEGGAFVLALHRWIARRQWENLPERPARRDPMARYRQPAKPAPPPPTAEDTEALRQFLAGTIAAVASEKSDSANVES